MKNVKEMQPEHEQRKCLNCGTVLHGHYCSSCGQKDENLHEPFWKLFAHAFSDFWHFDSKFFHTLLPLIIKPGFLTKEYVAGRRIRYVHPIRLYFFVSVVFFLIYFSASSSYLLNENHTIASDSLTVKKLGKLKDTIAIGGRNTAIIFSQRNSDSLDIRVDNGFISNKLPATVERYEDSISKLHGDSVPGFFQQMVDKKVIRANQEGDKQVAREIFETANHNFPKIMFVLLPLFALLLKLLYLSRKVYFVDHAVFALHFHAFAFITFLLAFFLTFIFPTLNPGGWIALLLVVYLFLSLRKMYGQTILKTLLKVFLLVVSYSLLIGIGVLILFVYSALTF